MASLLLTLLHVRNLCGNYEFNAHVARVRAKLDFGKLLASRKERNLVSFALTRIKRQLGKTPKRTRESLCTGYNCPREWQSATEISAVSGVCYYTYQWWSVLLLKVLSGLLRRSYFVKGYL